MTFFAKHRFSLRSLFVVLSVTVFLSGCASRSKFTDAAYSGDLATIGAFIEQGQDVNKIDGFGYTPLLTAVEHEQYDVAKLLIQHGAQVEKVTQNSGDNTIWGSPIHLAAYNGDTKMLALLSHAGADIDAKTEDGRDLTFLAVGSGNLETVKKAIELGAPIDNLSKNFSPLMLAAYAKHPHIIEYLLSVGANPNQLSSSLSFNNDTSQYGWGGFNALFFAIDEPIAGSNLYGSHLLNTNTQNQSLARKQQALEKNKANLTEQAQQELAEISSQLIMARSEPDHSKAKRKKDSIYLLLKAGTNLNGSTGKQSLLGRAVSYKLEPEVFGDLLRFGADPNKANWNKQIPLHIAMETQSQEHAELLLKYGSDIDVKDKQSHTPLHNAVKSGNHELASLLLKYGPDINNRDSEDESVLFEAVTNEDLEMTELLLANGAEVNTNNGSGGWTPLTEAAADGNKKIVESLIAYGADVDLATNKNYTPVYNAANEGYYEVVELLLKMGASPNIKVASNGWSPLHASAYNGFYNTTEWLIKGGANLNALTHKGSTPLDLALQEEYKKVGGLISGSGGRTERYEEDDGDGFMKFAVTAAVGGLALNSGLDAADTAQIMTATVKDVYFDGGGKNLTGLHMAKLTGDGSQIHDPVVRELFEHKQELDKQDAAFQKQLKQDVIKIKKQQRAAAKAQQQATKQLQAAQKQYRNQDTGQLKYNYQGSQYTKAEIAQIANKQRQQAISEAREQCLKKNGTYNGVDNNCTIINIKPLSEVAAERGIENLNEEQASALIGELTQDENTSLTKKGDSIATSKTVSTFEEVELPELKPVSNKIASSKNYKYTKYAAVFKGGRPLFTLEYGVHKKGYEGRVVWRFTNHSDTMIETVSIQNGTYHMRDNTTRSKGSETISNKVQSGKSYATVYDTINATENTGSVFNPKNDNPPESISFEDAIIRLTFNYKDHFRLDWAEFGELKYY
ncbi:ankyrin repeat domain-containing protein [Vibrio sp. HN007]|uniref:ankyrin repeat domain-containing protein n=1 Tax=Vibrio iocasae TaxID=3098914 RepID=UPI0035D4A35F